MTEIQNYTTYILEQLPHYGGRLLGAILIFLLGRLFTSIVKKAVRGSLRRSHTDETLTGFISSLTATALHAVFIIAAINQLGIQTTSLVAIFGAAGLAIGLALQGSLSNFAAGVLMIIFKPFKVGDFIEGAGVAGSVKEISLFTTTLSSPDNKKIIVPNAKLGGDNITNFSANGTRRVDMTFGVGYKSDLTKVKEIIESVIKSDERILEEPAPKIGVSALADNSINFIVRPWVNGADYWNVLFDTNKKMKEAFDEAGINIPFPQRDIHLYTDNTNKPSLKVSNE